VALRCDAFLSNGFYCIGRFRGHSRWLLGFGQSYAACCRDADRHHDLHAFGIAGAHAISGAQRQREFHAAADPVPGAEHEREFGFDPKPVARTIRVESGTDADADSAADSDPASDGSSHAVADRGADARADAESDSRADADVQQLDDLRLRQRARRL